MLHSSLSAGSELKYQANGLFEVVQQATQLLKSANVTAAARARTGETQDVLLGDVLADTVVNMSLSVDEARSLLQVLGMVRETIYERVLWQLAVDEAQGLVHWH